MPKGNGITSATVEDEFLLRMEYFRGYETIGCFKHPVYSYYNF
jgi:hypothetical protein